jgi:hypothetical protein
MVNAYLACGYTCGFSPPEVPDLLRRDEMAKVSVASVKVVYGAERVVLALRLGGGFGLFTSFRLGGGGLGGRWFGRGDRAQAVSAAPVASISRAGARSSAWRAVQAAAGIAGACSSALSAGLSAVVIESTLM